MNTSPQTLRFSSTAIVLKQPLLVALTAGFALVTLLLATVDTPNEPVGLSMVGPWLFWSVLLLVLLGCAVLVCWSQAVEIDRPAGQVRQTHRLLHFTVASSSQALSDFTAVRVRRIVEKDSEATTTPGGGFAKTALRTTYSARYELALLRPDIVLETAERKMVAERVPVDLPMEDKPDAVTVEALASQIAQLTGWPALRRGYAWVTDLGAVAPGPGPGCSVRPADPAAQSLITPWSSWKPQLDARSASNRNEKDEA